MGAIIQIRQVEASAEFVQRRPPLAEPQIPHLRVRLRLHDLMPPQLQSQIAQQSHAPQDEQRNIQFPGFLRHREHRGAAHLRADHEAPALSQQLRLRLQEVFRRAVPRLSMNIFVHLQQHLLQDLRARLAHMLFHEEEVVAQIPLGHDAAIHQREVAQAGQHEVLQQLRRGGGGVQHENARFHESLLPIGAPESQLAVILVACGHLHRHFRAVKGG
mmetsp:Transcript_7081/g.27142  ORF Transcript_7081/g.27142 Transcript_7081/m.27142 type:complete len:216 (+) Transcript_7081:1009-1656(+)|eukprot:scaffold1307_cov200-Pinguiococcus_pyrenoidosus.AAC.42